MQKILYLLLFVSFTSLGQNNKVKLNININNTKTNKHINIPGTRICIIPPPNYKISFQSMGLPDKSIFFSFSDDKKVSFFANAELFLTNNSFKEQGYTVLDSMNLKVNGYNAVFHILKTRKNLKEYYLAFGNETFYETINIFFKNTIQDKNKENEIIQSLNSICFVIDENKLRYLNTCFSLIDTFSNFKFEYLGNKPKELVYVYEILNPNINFIEYDAKILVWEYKKVTMDSNSIEKFIERNLGKWWALENVNPKIKKTITTIGNNYEAYQIDFTTKREMDKVHSYSYYLKRGNKFIVLSLLIDNIKNFDYYIQEFNKLVNTIRFKQEN